MHIEKISEIIAHFIGLFEMTTDEMRLRTNYAEGAGPGADGPALPDQDAYTAAFSSDLQLKDYDPGVIYKSGSYDIEYGPARHLGRVSEDSLEKLAAIAAKDIPLPHFGDPTDIVLTDEPELTVFAGPGSAISHAIQVNVLYDDDYLDMTSSVHAPRDTSFVIEQLADFSTKAEIFTPFASLHRTDTYDGALKIAEDLESYIQNAQNTEDSGTASLGTDATHNFVRVDPEVNDTVYVNGKAETDIPVLDDFLPDRGLAKLQEEPYDNNTSVEQTDPTGNSLDVTAGANLLVNVASVINTGVIASVTAVMGNYHQVDAISQTFVYSDHDEFASALHASGHSAEEAGTVAKNIALFEHSTFEASSHADTDAAEPTFPSSWRVSVIDGDVSVVQWIEQYHFVSDNDTMTVTTSGSETTVLTGGNTSINFSSFFGMGMQYDLVIIGGNVLDINSITQISLLYDNDWVRAEDGADIQTGNNLIWNFASIHNVGTDSPFAAMPDYIVETQKAIEDRDPNMPEGLSFDVNFQGYAGLNVLYITGNLYDMTIIKQVSIFGDSDDVTQAASAILDINPDATVTIDTGSNAVINIAEIVDYDSFGQTTYLAGQLYSDAILIQGGLVEHDTTEPQPADDRLANEVIAFLDNDDPGGSDSADGVINAGHDFSWSSAHPADVMQAMVA
ncbi:hypothetical protein ACC699_28990 [Rhizobium ruizarguesonis]|jgi:hypothetical protein|uniref:hypothetical protein n=1 Tax=Rhizobium ruizarguesonis TaxID=2081791 RepID=UPI00102F54E2|nr:hypothetical protein [Rhizobium ruizarguesonis]MBY5850270.1 hypothetical protein [Rhizobium leguminosarum]MBY5890459.1 hypothetical protein [Rhizobium leguminosarum]QSZ01010.1 hypothetical protein J3P73_00400 [Rhizobium ruizarguesonis]TBA18911.1 hypothetical protein ELH65_24730 [Rhizobium ruizarguesonis]TBC11825.1 hypothetical protein ELH37_23265 [Rhizobium ruizarguesonis]